MEAKHTTRATGRARAITINRSQGELERAWHDFVYGAAWREQVVSTQVQPLPHSRGTLLRVELADDAKTADIELALRQLKALQEAGEIPSTEGQPSGRRGLVERVKESLTPRRAARKESAA